MAARGQRSKLTEISGNRVTFQPILIPARRISTLWHEPFASYPDRSLSRVCQSLMPKGVPSYASGMPRQGP